MFSLPWKLLALCASLIASLAQAKAPTWKQIDQLVEDQKLQAASEGIDVRLKEARARGDEEEWAKALVRGTRVRLGLHGYETAVKALRDQSWPQSPLAKNAVNLAYASALVTYAQAYGWEIRGRERVESKGTVDLKAWTHEQIIAEAHRAFAEVWATRASLGTTSARRYGEYLELGTYPDSVRGTLRDALGYLFVATLADSGTWSPAHSNDLFRLDAAALIKGGVPGVKLEDPQVHPLLKLGAVLEDLESWHRGAGRKEAELEARLERIRRLSEHFTGKQKRALLHADLADRLPQFRSVPWFTMGKATLAELSLGDQDLVAAHRIATEGSAVFPGSPGNQRCLAMVKEIGAPDFQLATMATDGLGKRSLQLGHKNLARVFFRAYRLDLDQLVAQWKDYSLLPQGKALERLVASQTPVARWTAALPPTPDFQQHQTYVTPPLEQHGLYLVVASAREDFSQTRNRVVASALHLSPLVLVSRQLSPSEHQVRVVNGESGTGVAGAVVELYRYDWNRSHQKVDSKTTDAQGMAIWNEAPGGKHEGYFLIARHGEARAFDPQQLGFYPQPGQAERSGAFVYTDRSIYRPLQKIRWKVVAYQGRSERADFRTLASSPVTVTLLDANRQKLESVQVRTNSFGSVAGEFLIPRGRALGAWSIQTSPGGAAQVRVEEYKRPTFEAEFPPAQGPLRLNKPVTVTGTARYYFGQPVAAGKVRWQVVRQPRYPWWWSWYRLPAGQPQTIATGAGTLKEDGTFSVTFTPEAEEGVESREVSYAYAVTAEITDEGGETRTAQRSFAIGFTAVTATVEPGGGFFRAGHPVSFTVRRTDLDGNPRAGAGQWRILALQQPGQTLLPADEPIPEPPIKKDRPGLQTPGDKLRPRWETDYQLERTLRTWTDGAQVAQGTLSAAVARVETRLQAGGAYRLRYETVDEFGARFETQHEFVVAGARLSVPLGLWVESPSVTAGGTARLLVASGLAEQPVVLELQRPHRPLERRFLTLTGPATLIELPVTPQDRGGLLVSLVGVRDFQLLRFTQTVVVPYDHKELKVEFSTFRDRLRPGAKETFRVTVKGSRAESVERGAAEVLAYMYDRSLDAFAPHTPPTPISLFTQRTAFGWTRSTLGAGQVMWIWNDRFPEVPEAPDLIPVQLKVLDGYGIGGPGGKGRGGGRAMPMAVARESKAMSKEESRSEGAPPPPPAPPGEADLAMANQAAPAPAAEGPQLRTHFSETAFFLPQLLTDAAGTSVFEFQVPDSVTSWNVWAHAVTRDLRSGSTRKETRSIKELMVRPYVPRFFREGDEAELQVAINSAAEKDASGTLKLVITDLESGKAVTQQFLAAGEQTAKKFTVAAGKGTTVGFRLKAPRGVGTYSFQLTAQAGALGDGELRPVPVLPSRLHLTQSRFATLHDVSRKVLRFEDLARNDDPSRQTEQLVVTVDAQLFYTALQALPYLATYPYECTEQTLNRFVSTGIVSSLYAQYPAVGQMAKTLSTRKTQLEQWDAPDPNRKMLLEETPWLEEAKGGSAPEEALLNVLDPKIAAEQQQVALGQLQKMQTSVGAFPWFPGGPPSPYMTLYILHGLARAAEYKVPVPKEMTVRAWQYVAQHYRTEYAAQLKKQEGCCTEFTTFLNYVATAFPDASDTGQALTLEERRTMLDHSFRHWKEHSPYLKGYLALTLQRMGRPADAGKVFASVMDSAQTTEEQGTFWAPEDRGWLWYNDAIETHAFALRVLLELDPKDARRHGLVQWLLINKKLSHWKSTRATAEAIYALVKYLEQEGALGIHEELVVTAGPRTVKLAFSPDQFTGKKNQIVIDGEQIDPSRHAEVVVEKKTRGFAFASATWHFATDQLPQEERGDFFSVSRKYFRRDKQGKQTVLQPLAEGAAIAVGDEIEVQLSIRTKHAAEFVHLHDPRAAGLEPDRAVSGYKWETGVAFYEETRDSATNFFFDWLPVGEYTLRYRLRANLAGTFRIGPATLQSMYAPEFNAYSTGYAMSVKGQQK